MVSNNFSEIRQGKIIEIDIDEKEEKAISIAEEMCKKLLVNLIIEDYEIIFDRENK